ncbi:unnamed protein product [Penicillium pancosmium]
MILQRFQEFQGTSQGRTFPESILYKLSAFLIWNLLSLLQSPFSVLVFPFSLLPLPLTPLYYHPHCTLTHCIQPSSHSFHFNHPTSLPSISDRKDVQSSAEMDCPKPEPGIAPPPARWSFNSFFLSVIITVLLAFLVLEVYRFASEKPREKPKRRQISKSKRLYQPMDAVVIPESPKTPTIRRSQTRNMPPSPPESSPSLSSTFSVPTTPGSEYNAIPEGFPHGANLKLTREQLREAFYFSPKDRRIIDPEEKYWGRGRKSSLRAEFWEFIFERSEDYNPLIDETPYDLPEFVLRSNIGSDWASRARYFEKPHLYDCKGRYRDTPPTSRLR